jgi:creatinine amidohydrolase
MNLISWQEFQKTVPAQIETVLIPTGTMEAHGVLPNGSDNIAPEAMARDIAVRLNAMIAPTLNYGITGSMDAFPGNMTIREEAYEPFITDILDGLAKNGFKNLVILNGHGGGQTAVLQRAAANAGRRNRVRVLVTNWWSIASDITKDVFGQDGGHAGNNETAYIQAIVPQHVHKENYSREMATANVPAATWTAYPSVSSIGLYQPNQGYPDFDPEKARIYFRRVNDRMVELIKDVIAKWDAAKMFR